MFERSQRICITKTALAGSLALSLLATPLLSPAWADGDTGSPSVRARQDRQPPRSPEAPAQPNSPGQPGTPNQPAGPAVDQPMPRVSLRLDEMDLREAIQRVSLDAQLDVIVAQGVAGKVSGEFRNQPADVVLQTLAEAVGAELIRIESIFVIRPKRDPNAAPTNAERLTPGDPNPGELPVTGAGSLLPGELMRDPQPGQGQNLVGEPPAQGPASERREIPVDHMSAAQLARLLGGVGIGADGQPLSPLSPASPTAGPGWPNYGGYPPGYGPGYGGDPWAHLPPGSRVTRNGTILLPNGTTILRSGVIITPGGQVIVPQPDPRQYVVPWGWSPSGGYGYGNTGWRPDATYPAGALSGSLFGFNFRTDGRGTSIQPPAINFGGGTLQLPGLFFYNPNQNHGYGYGPGYGYPPGYQPGAGGSGWHQNSGWHNNSGWLPTNPNGGNGGQAPDDPTIVR